MSNQTPWSPAQGPYPQDRGVGDEPTVNLDAVAAALRMSAEEADKVFVSTTQWREMRRTG